MLVSTCLHAANAAVGEGDHAGHVETLPPSSETFPLDFTEGPRVLGGTGPPPFLPTARGGETFPRRGRAMLAWPVARRAAPSLATWSYIVSYVNSGRTG